MITCLYLNKSYIFVPLSLISFKSLIFLADLFIFFNESVSDIIKTLTANAATAKSLVKAIVSLLSSKRKPCSYGCDRALEYAIITDKSKISDEEKKRLRPIAGRILG